MRYIEVCVNTPADEIERRCEEMTAMGAEGFVIENEADFQDFLENNHQYWDYVDDELESRFPAWLDENVPLNPMKCEYFLPLIPNALIREGRGTVRVLTTDERWFGVTYHDDLAAVQTAVAAMKREGRYPEKLWEK